MNNDELIKKLDIALEILLFIFIITVSLIFDRRLGIVFSLTKTTCIRLLMLVIIGVISVRGFIFGAWSFKKSPFDWHVLTYLLCVAAATVTSINVYTSFAGSYGRYEGSSTIIMFCLLFFLSTNLLTDNVRRIRMSVAILLCGVVMAVYGIIQRMGIDPYMWGGVVTNERVIATIGQPNFLAAYLLMSAMLGISFLFRPNIEDKKSKFNFSDLYEQASIVGLYFFIPAFFIYLIYSVVLDSARNPFGWYIAFSVLILAILAFVYYFEKLKFYIQDFLAIFSICLVYVGILFTQSRGGLIGFIGGLSLLIMIVPKNLFFENWKKLLILVLMLAAISGSVFLQGKFSPISRFGEEIKVEEKVAAEDVKFTGAAGSRIETWTSAIKIIADRPIFGIGPEVLKSIFPRYETEMFRFYEAFHVKQDRCHNETLDVPVTKGIITLFVYLWLVLSLFIFGIRKISAIGRSASGGKNSDMQSAVIIVGFLSAALAYLFQNQFSFGVVAITSPFWVILGGVAGFGVIIKAEKSVKPLNQQWFVCSIIILVLIFAAVISTFQYNADICFKSGKMYFESGNVEKSISEYKKAISITPFDGGLYTNLGIAVLNMAFREQSTDGWFKETIKTFTEGSFVDPYNADNLYLRGKAYLAFTDAGNNFAANVVADSKRALEIDPYYGEAYVNLAMVYERFGNAKEAALMYEKAFLINPTMTVWLREIERIYQKNNLPGIISVFENILSKYPDRLEILASMGTLYSEKGMLDRAQQIFNRILKIDSSNIAGINGVASVMLKKGLIDAAFIKYQEALLIDPRNVDTHNGLGFIYFKKGKIKEAKEEFEIVLIYDPANVYAKKMLGVL